MDNKKDYINKINKEKENIKQLTMELYLFNTLIKNNPNTLEIEIGRRLKKRVNNRYNWHINNAENSIDFYQRLLNKEDISIHF